jgi:glucose/arabinose dehydrogenase
MGRLRVASIFLCLGACGSDGGSQPIDAPIDAPPPIDGLAALCTPRPGTAVGLETVGEGYDQPLLVTSAPNDRRLFVIEQPGVIWIIDDGARLATPFLDVSELVYCCGEQGLLGMALHPDFRNNGRFYLAYTGRGDSRDHVFVEYIAPGGGNVADPASARELLRFYDPGGNHNGGMIEFGNDGMLYIAIGDGGGTGDPGDNAQNVARLFGKILRIDVDTRTGTKPYGIPADNPYALSPDGPDDPRPEVWQYGLRNPFRFSFDRATGDIYIGDVGQALWEEIDAAPNLPDINWGWDDREGRHCYEPADGCLTDGRTEPVVEFSQADGWSSIMGGQVYRGTCFPDLAGTYFYSDHFVGELWAFELVDGAAQNNRQITTISGPFGGVTSIHADSLGELYVTRIDGNVQRIIVN